MQSTSGTRRPTFIDDLSAQIGITDNANRSTSDDRLQSASLSGLTLC